MRIVIKIDGWDGGADVVVRVSREGGDTSALSTVESQAADAGSAPAGPEDFAGAAITAARVPTAGQAGNEPVVTDAGPAPTFDAIEFGDPADDDRA